MDQESYHLKAEEAHHLIHVVRIELHEEVLLLNGAGLRIITKVSSVSKREVILSRMDSTCVQSTSTYDLALGIPKKDALELSLKQAVELGFRRIYLIRADYSQTKLPEAERLEAILISALEQSNASYLPSLIPTSWAELPVTDYGQILMMDSQHSSEGVKKSNPLDQKLLIVGPEGGFSPAEANFLHSLPKVQVLNLPTAILRTPTAVAAGAGMILGSLLD
jgi:16S rRNA (uracil1498-N3)-methyltransferase